MPPTPLRQKLRQYTAPIALMILVLLAGIAIATSSHSQALVSPPDEENSLLEMPPPQSMNELLRPAQVIVIGSIGPIVQHGVFAGYDKNGKAIYTLSVNTPGTGGVPFTDYQILMEQVLKDDGTIAAGKQLIVRMPGDHSLGIDRVGTFLISAPGDRHLFILSRNPDKITYGFYYGPWSRLTIDGQVVTPSDTKHTPLFGKNTTPTNFIHELTDSVKTVH